MKKAFAFSLAQIFKRKDRDAFFHGSGERTSRSFAQKRENRSGERGHHQQPDRHCRPTHMGVMFLNRLQLARQVRITNLIGVKVGHAHPRTVFHLEGADVVQERSPSFVFRQILGHMMGQKNVPGVATIHHSLGQVDARAGHVRPFVHIHHTTDRPAVNAHPDLQALIVLQRPADLKGALRRFLGTLIEHQRHAIAGRDF